MVVTLPTMIGETLMHCLRLSYSNDPILNYPVHLVEESTSVCYCQWETLLFNI